MRLKVDRDGERVVVYSWDLRIVAGAVLAGVVLVVMVVLDLSHPVASLECVRHEQVDRFLFGYDSGGAPSAYRRRRLSSSTLASSGAPIVEHQQQQQPPVASSSSFVGSSSLQTHRRRRPGEDNDCELTVRRRVLPKGGGAKMLNRVESMSGDWMQPPPRMQQDHDDAGGSLRAWLLGLMGVQEFLFSFEIDSASAFRLFTLQQQQERQQERQQRPCSRRSRSNAAATAARRAASTRVHAPARAAPPSPG